MRPARELLEEVGLRLDDCGPEIWTRTALFPMAQWDGQVDPIHLVRVRHFAPEPRLSPERLLAENVHEMRRWPLPELMTSAAVFSPRALPSLVEALLTGPIPTQPVLLTGF